MSLHLNYPYNQDTYILTILTSFPNTEACCCC